MQTTWLYVLNRFSKMMSRNARTGRNGPLKPLNSGRQLCLIKPSPPGPFAVVLRFNHLPVGNLLNLQWRWNVTYFFLYRLILRGSRSDIMFFFGAWTTSSFFYRWIDAAQGSVKNSCLNVKVGKNILCGVLGRVWCLLMYSMYAYTIQSSFVAFEH